MHVTDANRRKNPNPQGKGALPVLRDLALFSAAGVRRKDPVEFFRDYCVSSLVLAARFQFRPVVGNTYYLYSRDDDWLLSLISPDEWGARQPGPFVASCLLREDMTWAVAFADLGTEPGVEKKLQRYVEAFTDTLERQEDVIDHLPWYVRHLPYYRRVLASGLAASLQLSSPPAPALRALLDARPRPLPTGGDGPA
jgi:hypothetical protein